MPLCSRVGKEGAHQPARRLPNPWDSFVFFVFSHQQRSVHHIDYYVLRSTEYRPLDMLHCFY